MVRALPRVAGYAGRSTGRERRASQSRELPRRNIPARPDQKGNLYEPILPENVELKYGKEYEFRVRLGDLSGGGPS